MCSERGLFSRGAFVFFWVLGWIALAVDGARVALSGVVEAHGKALVSPCFFCGSLGALFVAGTVDAYFALWSERRPCRLRWMFFPAWLLVELALFFCIQVAARMGGGEGRLLGFCRLSDGFAGHAFGHGGVDCATAAGSVVAVHPAGRAGVLVAGVAVSGALRLKCVVNGNLAHYAG